MKSDWQGFVRELQSDRGWRVVVVAGVGYGLGLTVLPFYTLGAFVAPLEAAFGWSRGEVQASLAWLTLATLVAAWFVGWLTDRYGVRKVALGGQLGLAIGLALLALSPGSLALWYATWFLMSVIGLGTSPITWTRAIAGWFDAGRGLALALALAGSGIVALVAPVSVALLVDAIGWRLSYLALAAAVFLIALPTTWRLLPAQSTRSLATNPTAPPLERLGLCVREILAGYRFWLIIASAAAAGFAMAGMIPNLVPLLVERGLNAAVASGFLGLLGITVIVGRLTAGYALDRIWAPAVACLFLPWSALGCILLALGTTDYVLIGISVALLGFATGAEFDLVPYLCSRYFGMRSYSRIYALQWMGFTLAAGMAPAIFGYTYDFTGSYQAILYVAAALFVFAPLILLLLGRYPVFTPGQAMNAERAPGHLGASGTVLAKTE